MVIKSWCHTICSLFCKHEIALVFWKLILWNHFWSLSVCAGQYLDINPHLIAEHQCLTLKAPITTAADDKFYIFLNFQQKQGIILHENRLSADDSHEIACLICYFWKSGKISNCRLLQIISGALTVKYSLRWHTQVPRERSGSVVECLARDRRVAGSSLTGVTALWSLSKTHLS